MADTENRFKSLADEFDRLADTLRETEDPAERRQILGRMRALVADLERITANDGAGYQSLADVPARRIT